MLVSPNLLKAYMHFNDFIAPSVYVYLTKRFHVAVRLFSNRSQMTSKSGKNKKVAHEAQPSVSLMFFPHFDVLCDLLFYQSILVIGKGQ